MLAAELLTNKQERQYFFTVPLHIPFRLRIYLFGLHVAKSLGHFAISVREKKMEKNISC